MTESTSSPLTVGSLIAHVAPDHAASAGPPGWPPDAFAIAASVLQASGGYRSVVSEWPPPSRRKAAWSAWIAGVGHRWRQAYNAEPSPPRLPGAVKTWWKTLWDQAALPLHEVAKDRGLCTALIQLCAAADSACAGIGLQTTSSMYDRTSRTGGRLLLKTSRSSTGATLCTASVRAQTARVLPKLHTPQTGITLRSLSHNLAMVLSDEVIPRWVTLVDFVQSDRRMLNILLVPWPETIARNQFKPVPAEQGIPCRMADGFHFFDFDRPSSPDQVPGKLEGIYEAALREAGQIHLVVLPELALDGAELEQARAWADDRRLHLIAGTSAGQNGRPHGNTVVQQIPFTSGSSIFIEQSKHHRWQLNRSQIEAYGLGGHLDPSIRWWEHMEIEGRSLWFVSLLPWLTFCVLVCEDLAQQEPAARILRSIGPNLVIALLMDGPQLGARWPARYATVLADDPGSSVLTLTSIGMCERSLPPGAQPSRAVALWKDHRGQREISLAPGAQALVLNLLIEKREEWSADGRTDDGQAGLPVLVGAYDVRVRKPEPDTAAKPARRRGTRPR